MIAGAAVLGTLVALPLAVLLAMRRRVPIVLGAVPGGLVLLAALGVHLRYASLAGLSRVPVPLTLPAMAGRLELVDGTLRWTGLAIAVPVGVVLIGSAVAAVRSGRKQPGTVAAGLVLVLLYASGFFREVIRLHPDAQLTGVLIGVVLGLVAVVGLLGADPGDNGPEAAGVAGIAYATGLVGIAIGFRSAESAQVYAALQQVDPADARRLFAAGQSVVLLLEGRGWLTLVWGAGFALLGIGTAAGREGARRIEAGVAVLSLALLVGLFARTDTEALWTSFLRQLDDRVTASPTRDYQLPIVERAAPVGLNSALRVSQRRIFLDGEPVGTLEAGLGEAGEEREVLRDPLPVEQAVRTMASRYPAAPYDGALTLAVDKRIRLETVLQLVQAVRAGGATRLDARVIRSTATDGAVPIQVDLAPDPVPAVDGHDPYPLRLQLLPTEVHLFVREQRIELDCLGVCENPTFATSVLEQLAEAEPGEPEVLVIPWRDQSWDSLLFWLTVQPDEPGMPLLTSRVIGTTAWVPAIREPSEEAAEAPDP